MRPQFLMFCAIIALGGTLLACFSSGRWINNGETNIINALASFNTMSVQAGGGWTAPKTLATYWDAAVTFFSWNYPFLQGGWAFFIRLPLIVITIGATWGFIQLAIAVIGSLVSMVRYFIPGG